MHDDTHCVYGRDGDDPPFRSLTPAVHRASTIVFPTVEAYQSRREAIYDGYSYGLYGTPTARTLEKRIARLEGAEKCLVVQSGFAAIVLTTLAFARTGSRVLFPDNGYETLRPFAADFLDGLGIEAQFYDPMRPDAVDRLLGPNTPLLWLEAPGSVTMETPDVADLVARAHRHGAKVAADNTWATPLRFRPLDHGVDVSMNAASKYLSGHSDVIMGSLAVRDEALYRRLKDVSRFMGCGVSADDASLVLRGLETLAVRLDRSEATATHLAAWFAEQSWVAEVRHPARPGTPGHDAWKRDFAGGSGLFSVYVHDAARARLDACVESLELFAIGASWGGTHSVVAAMRQVPPRTATPASHVGPVLRFSAGLENVEDLLTDLRRAFAPLAATAAQEGIG